MVATNLTVKVHPVVYMTMVDSYERRPQGENRALGTLLGFYEKNVVQITNCYAIPFRDTGSETPEINDNFNRAMWVVSKRAAPSEQIVGWFFTVSDIPDCCAYYHSYYATLMAAEAIKKEVPPAILLTMDVSFKIDPGRLTVQAFIQSDAGNAGQNSQPSFVSLKVEMDAFQGENVVLGVISKSLGVDEREIRLPSPLDQLVDSVEEMIQWLEKILAYVDKVITSGKLPQDTDIGQRLMELVTLASTQLQPEKLESMIKMSTRDYLMIDYLATLTKTQLSFQEKLLSM